MADRPCEVKPVDVSSLSPGDLFTIFEGGGADVPAEVGGAPTIVRVNDPYEPFKGMPLEVMAIDRPYIVAKIIPVSHARAAQGGPPARTIIDARSVKLMRLSETYVNAFLDPAPPQAAADQATDPRPQATGQSGVQGP